MSLVKVAGLLEPGALVEIEGVAVLPDATTPAAPGGAR
jgi:enamine deaminase RidA (YjgF/YER057c/UK114 family)